MKKKFAIRSLAVMSSIFVIGLIFVFSSGAIGENAGSKAIRRNGGSMDTSAYERVINTTSLNYQVTGGILSLVGGFGILLSGYAIYKEIE